MKKCSTLGLSLIPFLMLAGTVNAEDAKPKRQASTPGAKVYIVQPKDGEVVKGPVKVIFGLTGMGISPAGITVDGQPIPDTGHHHLLVDVDKMPPLDVPLPSDQVDHVKHFGKGQTETMLELPPGDHTLQLVFADYAHVAHDPPVISQKIKIKVRK